MKNIKTLIIILLLGITIISCKKDDDFDRAVEVEFNTPASTVNDNLSGIEIKVQMDGPQKSADVNITYNIESTSTAVEGQNYSMVSEGTVTIPANSNFGYITLNTLNVPTGSSQKIDFKLTGGDFQARPATSTHTMTIVGPLAKLRKIADTDTTTSLVSAAILDLVGTPRNIAQGIDFSINSASTAINGVHYNMISTGSQATIAANGDSAIIDFEVIENAMQTESKDLTLMFDIENTGDLVTQDTLYTFTFIAPKVNFGVTDSIVENNAGAIEIPLQLDGNVASIDRDVDFEIDAASTAVEGSHFNVVKTVTIPANSTKATITINVLDGLTSLNKDVQLILNVTDTGDLGIGSNGYLTLTIQAP